MASPFDLQQTPETIAERWKNFRYATPEQMAELDRLAKIERTVRYKKRLIAEWRRKGKRG